MNDKEYIECLESKEKVQKETIDFLIKENEKLNNALNGKITAYKCREVDKIQSNWSSLREWLEKVSQEEPMPRTEHFNWVYNNVLDYMNELEGVDNE